MKLNELKAWLSQLYPELESIFNDSKCGWNWKDQFGYKGRENCMVTVNRLSKNLWYLRISISYPKNYYNSEDRSILNLSILSKIIFIIIYDVASEEVRNITIDNEIDLRLFDYKTSKTKSIDVKNIIYDSELDNLITLEIADKEI